MLTLVSPTLRLIVCPFAELIFSFSCSKVMKQYFFPPMIINTIHAPAESACRTFISCSARYPVAAMGESACFKPQSSFHDIEPPA